MTEQEQIEAINALCSLLHWKLKDKSWQECDTQEKEMLRHHATLALRTLYSDDFLNAEDIYDFLVMNGRWKDATEQERLICENAVTVMREVIESEL